MSLAGEGRAEGPVRQVQLAPSSSAGGRVETPLAAGTSDPGTGSWDPEPRTPGQLAHLCACVHACLCVCEYMCRRAWEHTRVDVCALCVDARVATCVRVCAVYRLPVCCQEDLDMSPTCADMLCDGNRPWTSLSLPFPP